MRISSYKEFWKFYLKEHSHPRNRALHFVGTSLGLLLLGISIWQRDWRWLLVALFAGYGLAWLGHFFVEKNRPATFRYPLWSLISDFRMWFRILFRRPLE